MPRLVALVKGRVQGVGYRAFAQKKALELGLSGYAENLPDGRVEVVAEGPKEALELFLHHLKQGPRLAVVPQAPASKAPASPGWRRWRSSGGRRRG